MKNVQKTAIIGPGKVGCSLALMLSKKGCGITALGGRDVNKAKELVTRHRIDSVACSIPEAASGADVVLITVKDDAIEEVVSKCIFKPGAHVIHMSGAHSSNVLAHARETFHCNVASMHVLQTFATVEQACRVLPNSYCFIEGDDDACETAKTLAAMLDFKTVRIQPDSKVLYHAAAVTACNGMTALLHAVIQTATEAGIPQEQVLPAFEPLLRATLENNLKQGPGHALTGPAARGDANTLALHLEALQKRPDLKQLYHALEDYTVQRMLDPESPDTQRLRQLFKQAPSKRRGITVGVMGSGNSPFSERSEPLGRWLAEEGYNLLTGGGSGVMKAVSCAFFQTPNRAGHVIGVLPASEDENSSAPPPGYPNPWVELPIRTHLSTRGQRGDARDSRNHINILSSDIIVALPGSHGTASEVRLAQHYGRPVIAFVNDASDIPELSAAVPVAHTLDEVIRFILDKSLFLKQQNV